MRWLFYSFLALFSLGVLGLAGAAAGTMWVVNYYGKDLPDYEGLKNYNPPVVTRVYAGDGRLMAEFAEQKRAFVPIEAVPDIVKQAFIAAEDQNFYSHKGVDFVAIARAMVRNLKNAGTGRRPEGASTITQQVAKNFLLTNEVSYERKIKEAILSYRIEKAFSKEHILELYLNEIYLGEGTYGVGAAALSYFNKPLEDLRIDEAAFLAALPKAPNNYHPVRKHDAAVARRNWVIERMREDGYITNSQAELAESMPLEARGRKKLNLVEAPYFAEEVRRELIESYGDDALYGGGLVVRASIDPRLQAIAEKALRDGLIAYDRRQGSWRGPVKKMGNLSAWQKELTALPPPPEMPPYWKLAVVLSVTADHAVIGFADGKQDKILDKYAGWAKKGGGGTIRDVLKPGDIVMTERVTEDGQSIVALRQIPKINGAVVALDPHTGRVLAAQGGWSYEKSEFNRVTQATRQPGSAFKPFVYLPALDKGFTPATLVVDAPMVFEQGPGMPKWRPTNYKDEYYGPTPIRVGIEKSRNLMTVRLADHIGMEMVADYARKFGVLDNLEPYLSNALGSGETTLLRLTTGYAQLVNGGRKITPTFIDRIQDRRGITIKNRDSRPCDGCGPLLEWRNQSTPVVPDTREQIGDPRTAYQMVSMLEGVVQRGTAVKLRELGRPLAGKTGTTNESKDVWFIGFSPDLVVGVFVGFDEPKSLGKKETGASVAVPIFYDVMKEALKDTPPVPFRVPPGVRQVQINAHTGARAQPGDEKVIWEAFLTGTEPGDGLITILDAGGLTQTAPAAGGNAPDSYSGTGAAPDPSAAATLGTGGLY